MDWLGDILVSAVAGGLVGGVVSYFVGLKQDAKIRERNAEADLQLLLGLLPLDTDASEGGMQPVDYASLQAATGWTVAKLNDAIESLTADGRIRHAARRGYYAIAAKPRRGLSLRKD